MGDEDIVGNSSSRHKCGLIFRDDRREKWLKAFRQDLGDDLVVDIAQGDRPIIRHCLWASFFWNQSNESIIDSRWKDTGGEEPLYFQDYFLPNGFPIGMEEPG